MELTLWTYEGPPHVGAMRVVTAMRGTHLVLHAPQGDTYADLLFTMIERNNRRPPVTYTTFQARDLGGDTADLVCRTVADAEARFRPDLLVVGESCTAELIQDQPGTLAAGMKLGVPVVPVELPAYSRKENWGASETFYRLVRALCAPGDSRRAPAPDAPVSVNILGGTALGFRCRDDLIEVRRILDSLGLAVNVIAPDGAAPADLARLPDAHFNICLYPEIAETVCAWLKRTHGQPYTRVVPIGVGATRDFIKEVASLAGVDPSAALRDGQSRLPWYSRSVDSTYLTGKRAFIFGDACHAVAAARIARDELGFEVVGLGTYSREHARLVRDAARDHGLEALISDNYLEVERHVAALQPELVLGTQMERHIAKRLGIPCAVISAPFHVQDVPARYAPQMGFEGANVIFDTWVHPLMMGLEEHLLCMFRDDFEFNDQAAASHVGERSSPVNVPLPRTSGGDTEAGSGVWTEGAERELRKIPFFVRGKARRNTERFAADRGIGQITVETLYDAKAHFGR